jgi:glycosyltransferase involved in cell wall biosynthesis
VSKVLYLSYDGISDPLGQSQVVPYLRGLRQRGHEIDLVSFEKPARLKPVREALAAAMEREGITWHPLSYTKYPPVLSAVFDVFRLKQVVRRLHQRRQFDLVHCRSYLTALVGLALKREAAVRFLFDMRGFWADEKVDAGAWNLRNPVYRRVYRFFKTREAEFLSEADAVVSLTRSGRREIGRWTRDGGDPVRIEVIPCAADFELFRIAAVADRTQARRELGISLESLVVAYLGSIGTWYLLGEMLDWFSVLLERYPDARFLFVTPDAEHVVHGEAAKRQLDPDSVIVVSASRAGVPFYLAAADLGVFFIRPTYSKQSSSPTKLGELLAMGIPVVTNTGVGDVDESIEALAAGVIVPEFSREAYTHSLDALPILLTADRHALRERAKPVFDLEVGVAAYQRVYESLLRVSTRT